MLSTASALGVNGKARSYDIEKVVDSRKGLISQVLQEPDGSYSVMKLLAK